MEPLPDQLKIYRLCKMLACTPSQLEEESAATLDWLLAIDEVFITTENKIRNGEA